MSKINQAIAAHNTGNIREAERLYAEILADQPNYADALHYYGLILADTNRIDLAKANLEKALALKPDNAHFHHNSAGFFSRIGLTDQATYHFLEAIRLKPDYCEAYQGLTESITCDRQAGLLKKIEKQLQNAAIPEQKKSYLYFAAGKICADSKNYQAAGEYYRKANAGKGVTFDSLKTSQETDRQIQYFNDAFLEKTKEWGLFARTPVFIVGMPRSGSTLTEQILASHSSVHGAGELLDIGNILNTLLAKSASKLPYPYVLNETNLHDLLGYGLSYLNRLNALANGKPRVVNKNLANFNYLGFIFLLFPNAKVIHTVRHPLDTCLSCYFQNFTRSQEYAFDLSNLADYYLNYHRLMRHWQAGYPGKIFQVDYDKLVTDPENSVKALLDYCELPWEADCLQFHETHRGVITASKYQVRKPIYSNSIGLWRHYPELLPPLTLKFKQHGLLTEAAEFA